ncbi:MAG TPA: ABC transporter substrate-binding protein [Gaiellaceae bacterium]|jgi:ABC-type branched-subunit amino acid transport system substrate-binding protein
MQSGSVARKTVGALALVAAVVAAAVVASTGSATSAGGTILIGSIAGTTGAYGSTGVAMVNGAKMAVADLNAKGGALGKKFTLQSYNDQASATLSSQLFQRLVSAGAVAVAGSGDTGPATAAMAQRLHIPNIGAVDDAGITIYPDGPSKPPFEWVWSWGLNTFAWGGIDAHYALKNCKGLAVLHDPSTYGGGGDAAIKLAYSKAGKKLALDNAISEDWSTGATVGLTNEINKIKASGADCVVVWLTPQDTARFMQTLKSTGTKLTVLGNDEINADNTFASLAGKAADGAIGAMLKTELHPTKALRSFQKRYKARFHIDSTPFAVANYDAIMMLGDVIKKVGSTDPNKLKDGLNSVRNYHGLQGTVSFSKQNHATITEKQLTLVRYSAAKKAWLPIK